MTEVGEGIAVNAPARPAKKKKAKKEKKPECDYQRKTHQSDYRGPDSKFVTSTQISPVNVAFRLEINVSRRRLKIISIFKWGTVAADVTRKQKNLTIKKFKAKVRGWGGRFRLKVVDPQCGTHTLPILFRLQWSPNDTADAAPYKVNLYKTYPRAGVSGWDVDIGYVSDVTPDGGWVLAHEYGHTLCLQDEYFYAGVAAATVAYKKADGSSENVALEPAGKNIMRTHANRKYLKRFFYFAAIEAQELLRKKAGRNNITCEIV